MHQIDELRVRLGRADQDGRKAWSEVTAILRQVINAKAASGTVRDALDTVQQRHAVITAALNELQNVKTNLIHLTRLSPIEPPTSTARAIHCAYAVSLPSGFRRTCGPPRSHTSLRSR